jgi:hypothetical protein
MSKVWRIYECVYPATSTVPAEYKYRFVARYATHEIQAYLEGHNDTVRAGEAERGHWIAVRPGHEAEEAEALWVNLVMDEQP